MLEEEAVRRIQGAEGLDEQAAREPLQKLKGDFPAIVRVIHPPRGLGPATISPVVDMAVVFRVEARLGWNEQIGNHHSLMLPQSRVDETPRFLINPRGYLFQELTASSLIVCDLDGCVLRGKGELRKVAFHIHARIHLRKPEATCILHVPPRWLTALSLLETPRLALAHHNNLPLNDRVAVDDGGIAPADSNEEGDRLAAAMGDASILVMGGHGVTVVGPTVHDAFEELFIAERTVMYQLTAMSTGLAVRRLPESAPPLARCLGREDRCAPAPRRLAAGAGPRGTGLRKLMTGSDPGSRPGTAMT